MSRVLQSYVDVGAAANQIRNSRSNNNLQVAKEEAKKARIYRKLNKNKVHKRRVMSADEKRRRSLAAKRVWAKGMTKSGRKALYKGL